ncbi:MAG: ATP-binding protein [Rectinemataceae bacterium]
MADLKLFDMGISAEDASVKEFISLLHQRLTDLGVRERRFGIELVLREAIQNSIEHGCGLDPSRIVHVTLSLVAGRLLFSVEDAGCGFDPELELKRELSREAGTSGSGIHLISKYSDTYHYEDGGRKLVAEFAIGEDQAMQDNTGTGSWNPQADIVAASVPAVKEELRSLVAASQGEFTIDLSAVRMIDSKGLGLLIAAANSLVAQGRSLRVTGANEDLVGLFKMMRLDRHLKLG